jgi:hypothetical protein
MPAHHLSAFRLPRRRLLIALAALAALRPAAAHAEAFDSLHAAWTALLKKNVVVLDGGRSTQVRYAGMAAERAALKAYLAALSSVDTATFNGWSRTAQMAFLINAYNAFTVELILTRYPDLQSIKDLGSFLQSPWKKAFVPLLGETRSLDGIEQGLLRQRGKYDEPRIHFAVNCASIGCPPLREEAYVGERLDAQLDDQAHRFMSDRQRNRWNPATDALEVSKIFDWYIDDFRMGWQGITSTTAFFARYADLLADAPGDRQRIRAQRETVRYLAYDWKLNDAA